MIMNFYPIAGVNMEKYYRDSYGSIENLISLAKNGNVTAQEALGTAYSQGVENFVEKDVEKAIGWLNSAVEGGSVNALIYTNLGGLLDLTGKLQYKLKAHEMYHRAAKMGSKESQINLAEMYRCGVEGVVNEDIKEAFEWYKKAADEGADFNAQEGEINRLLAGTLNAVTGNGARLKALKLLYLNYLDGDCPEGRPQPTKAVYYMSKAAELGDAEAQLKLGEIYLNGSCEQIKDVKMAKRWLGKASSSGNAVAKQLLQQCEQCDDTQHDASGVSEEAVVQSLEILRERFGQTVEANKHPFLNSHPVLFSEEMLRQYDWSPTARIYLKAYKLVKQGLEILCKSNFTDAKGISLIAHGYLTQNSILQAFPSIKNELLPNILKLCEKNLLKNPCFFEGLLLCLALRRYESAGKVSKENAKLDRKALMCIENLIHFIQKAEPSSNLAEDPYEFDRNYSSWLHVLYHHMAAIYIITEDNEEAAEACENSLKCCPSYYDAKRFLGYSLMNIYVAKINESHGDILVKLPNFTVKWPLKRQRPCEGPMSKYASWTAEKVRDTAVKVLKEYLEEMPCCFKHYPNAFYFLAMLHMNRNMTEFKKYYELGQDAEEKRLHFFGPYNLPLKDLMTPTYQLFSNVRQPVRCGNEACIKKVKESDLKACSRCRNQKYCSKACQTAHWKYHKAACSDSKGSKAKNECTV